MIAAPNYRDEKETSGEHIPGISGALMHHSLDKTRYTSRSGKEAEWKPFDVPPRAVMGRKRRFFVGPNAPARPWLSDGGFPLRWV